jgi:hypothetical protein
VVQVGGSALHEREEEGGGAARITCTYTSLATQRGAQWGVPTGAVQ